MAYADSLQNDPLKIFALTLLGINAERKPDHAMAIKYFMQALNLGGVDAYEDAKSNARLYHWLAQYYQTVDGGTRADSALAFIKMGYEANKKSMNYYDLSNLRFQEAEFYILRRANKALCEQKVKSFDSLYHFLKWDVLRSDEVLLHFDWLYMNHDLTKAVAMVNEEISALKQNHHTRGLKEWYATLMYMYYETADYENAFYYMDSMYDLEAQEFKKEQVATLSKYEAQYNSKEKELALLRTQLNLADERNRRNLVVAIALMLALAMTLYFVRYKRNVKNQFEKLKQAEAARRLQAIQEQKEKERHRISRELHDNIGAQLSMIRSSLNFLQDDHAQLGNLHKQSLLSQIEKTAYDAVLDLRDTIWVINIDEASFQALIEKMEKAITSRIAFIKHMQLKVHLCITQDFMMSAHVAINMLRIIQEATSNIIKHAQAQEIRLIIASWQPQSFEVSIADNGIGFTAVDTLHEQYGLENMKTRARNIGLHFKLTTGNAGITITIHS